MEEAERNPSPASSTLEGLPGLLCNEVSNQYVKKSLKNRTLHIIFKLLADMNVVSYGSMLWCKFQNYRVK